MSRFCYLSPFSQGIGAALFLPFAIFLLLTGYRAYGSNPTPKPDPSSAQLVRNYGALPLTFESNRGQAESSIRFLSNGTGYSVLFKNREVDMLLPTHGGRPNTLRMQLGDPDAGPIPVLAGENQLPERVNYFLGNDPAKWRTGVPTFEKVSYTRAFPGVDLLYYGNQNRLEFDFQVIPGANPKAIKLRFQGARKLQLDHDGNLMITMPNGSVIFHKPAIYQLIESAHKVQVKGSFLLLSKDTVGFRLGTYDHTKPLIIDPILSYSTYLNFPSANYPVLVAVSSAGEAYLTGAAPVLPITTPGAFQGSNMTKQGGSAFIAKFNQAGSALIYCTYLGGSGNDVANSIALDAQGNAYVVGQTSSTDFPTSTGAFQSVSKVPTDTVLPSYTGFVSEINSSGTGLIYSTYLGGSTGSKAAGVAVDSTGNAYVTGVTKDTDFPVTQGAVQSTNKASTGQNQTGFISKVNPDGTALSYSTYLGGSKEDFPSGIAVDSSGDAYVAGTAESTDFPITEGAFQTKNNAKFTVGFVTKLNPPGTALVYSTYLGGTFADVANAIALDGSGDAYLTGFASSADFPITPGAFQTSINGIVEAVFVTKLNPSGTAPIYSTFLSGGPNPAILRDAAEDIGVAIAVDSAGNAYVDGTTDGTQFPTTPGALQTTNLTFVNSGNTGSFVTELNSTGTSLVYSTYLSGSGDITYSGPLCECISGLAVDSAHNAYVTGVTFSNDFPVTPSPFQTTGGTFLTKFNASEMKQLPVPTVNITANANPQAPGLPVTFTAQLVPTAGASTPTGSISFSINESRNVVTTGGYPAIGQWQAVNLDTNGIGTFTTTALWNGGLNGGQGVNAITAYYSGDANNAPSSGSTTETISAGSGNLPVAISIKPSANPSPYGSPVTFNISVTDPSGKGTPVGYIEMLNNGALVDEILLDPNGNASITDDFLAAGSNNMTVWFATINTSYATSSLKYTQNVTPMGVAPIPVLSLPAGTYPMGQTVSITDAASPDAMILTTNNGSVPAGLNAARYTGPISLTQSETLSAVAIENGYSNSPVASAKYNIQLPTPTVSPAPGTYGSTQAVTISDSPYPVTIYYTTDGSQPTTSSIQYIGPITVGTSETIQAIANESGYASSNVVSAIYTITSPPPDFTMTLYPTSLTVHSGTSTTSSVTITPVNGFNQGVSFACSGLPAGVSCGFSPATVTPGTSAATTTLTIAATTTAKNALPTKFPFVPITSCVLALGCFAFRQRQSYLSSLFVLTGAVLLFSLSACGGGATNAPNPAPTSTSSTITVTATSGPLSHSQTLSLTLN